MVYFGSIRSTGQFCRYDTFNLSPTPSPHDLPDAHFRFKSAPNDHFPHNSSTDAPIVIPMASSLEDFLSVPVENLTMSQCSQVINYLLKEGAPLTSLHLDSAVKHRHFPLAIRVLNRGIDSPNLSSAISAHLSSPHPLDTDFDVFLFACVLYQTNISGLLNTFPSFPRHQIPHAAIALIPLFIASPTLSLSDPSTIFGGESNPLLFPYSYARQDVIQLTQKLADARLSLFEKVTVMLSSPEIFATVAKFATDLIAHVKDKGIRRNASDVVAFQTSLSEDINAIERYFLSTLLDPMQAINSLASEAKRIHVAVGRYVSAVDFIVANFSNRDVGETVDRLKSACVSFSQNEKLDPETFRTSLPTLQYLTAFLAYARHPSAVESVASFLGSVSNLPDSFSRDVPLWDAILVKPTEFHARISDPSGPLFQSVRQLTDALLFALYFIEAGKLESLVKFEALTYASATSKSLEFNDWSQTFKRFATQDLLNQFTQARDAREQIFRFAVDRISLFFQKIRAVPGSRPDIRYTDFQPARAWPWPAIPNCPFPATPAEVKEVLQLRGALQRELEEYILSQSTPICERCHTAIACTVCPKCRRLVLCNMCHDQTLKCPREGCDVTFAARSRHSK